MQTRLRRLAALAFGGLLAAASLGEPPALQPPIDTTPWKNPAPSTPLALLKQPHYSADYPTMADYLRVLERFPLLGERGWHANYLGDPHLGFFGDPDHAEMGLRAMGNFIFVMSLLAADQAYDPQVTGVDRATLLARARSCLDYMTRSHVTGDIPCGDGQHWGDHWQSAWWTAKMALGAHLIWDKLSSEQRDGVERVVVHEAFRHLARRAPSGERADTKAEENAWDTEVLAAALALFPKHPNAAAWRAKVIEFDLNSLSVKQDKFANRSVNGKPLREQVYTENVHADFTIENHGAYHVCYMACPLHSLAWGYYALQQAGQPVPEAQFHHFEDVWRRLKPTFLERRFAYVEGKDWPRYAYGMYFIMPALVVLSERLGDADARVIEARRFRTFEEEQLDNADGSFFGRRFTRNILLGRTGEFETDCYANLGVSYLLHRLHGRHPVRPPSEEAFERDLSARFISRESALAYVRTPEMFVSFAWRVLEGTWPTALFIPRGMDSAAEWGANNLLGRVHVAGVDPKKTVVEHSESDIGRGFKTSGRVVYCAKDGTRLFTHEITFVANPTTRTATVESRFVSNTDITVQSVEGLRLLVANDFFNGARRVWSSDTFTRTLIFDLANPFAEKETIVSSPLGAKWVNLDGRLGIVQSLPDGAPFVLRISNRRNSAYHSLHYDALDSPELNTSPRNCRADEEILHTKFLLVVGDARRTAALAAQQR